MPSSVNVLKVILKKVAVLQYISHKTHIDKKRKLKFQIGFYRLMYLILKLNFYLVIEPKRVHLVNAKNLPNLSNPLQIGITLANDVESYRIFSCLIFPCNG